MACGSACACDDCAAKRPAGSPDSYGKAPGGRTGPRSAARQEAASLGSAAARRRGARAGRGRTAALSPPDMAWPRPATGRGAAARPSVPGSADDTSSLVPPQALEPRPDPRTPEIQRPTSEPDLGVAPAGGGIPAGPPAGEPPAAETEAPSAFASGPSPAGPSGAIGEGAGFTEFGGSFFRGHGGGGGGGGGATAPVASDAADAAESVPGARWPYRDILLPNATMPSGEAYGAWSDIAGGPLVRPSPSAGTGAGCACVCTCVPKVTTPSDDGITFPGARSDKRLPEIEVPDAPPPPPPLAPADVSGPTTPSNPPGQAKPPGGPPSQARSKEPGGHAEEEKKRKSGPTSPSTPATQPVVLAKPQPVLTSPDAPAVDTRGAGGEAAGAAPDDGSAGGSSPSGDAAAPLSFPSATAVKTPAPWRGGAGHQTPFSQPPDSDSNYRATASKERRERQAAAREERQDLQKAEKQIRAAERADRTRYPGEQAKRREFDQIAQWRQRHREQDAAKSLRQAERALRALAGASHTREAEQYVAYAKRHAEQDQAKADRAQRREDEKRARIERATVHHPERKPSGTAGQQAGQGEEPPATRGAVVPAGSGAGGGGGGGGGGGHGLFPAGLGDISRESPVGSTVPGSGGSTAPGEIKHVMPDEFGGGKGGGKGAGKFPAGLGDVEKQAIGYVEQPPQAPLPPPPLSPPSHPLGGLPGALPAAAPAGSSHRVGGSDALGTAAGSRQAIGAGGPGIGVRVTGASQSAPGGPGHAADALGTRPPPGAPQAAAAPSVQMPAIALPQKYFEDLTSKPEKGSGFATQDVSQARAQPVPAGAGAPGGPALSLGSARGPSRLGASDQVARAAGAQAAAGVPAAPGPGAVASFSDSQAPSAVTREPAAAGAGAAPAGDTIPGQRPSAPQAAAPRRYGLMPAGTFSLPVSRGAGSAGLSSAAALASPLQPLAAAPMGPS